MPISKIFLYLTVIVNFVCIFNILDPHPSFCPGIFLELHHCFFSKFWHGAWNPHEVVHDISGFSRNKILPQGIRKMDQEWTQNRVFEFSEKFGNFYWICSVMKIYIICCVPAQIPYLGKLIPEICAKMFSANQIAVFLSTIAPEQIIEMTWFLAYWCKFTRIKSVFECARSKMGLASLVMEL